MEYLKYMINYRLFSDDVPQEHPLIHMHILGDGPSFRKATLRISGVMTFGIGMRNGVPAQIFEDDIRWQELRNGRWEDL